MAVGSSVQVAIVGGGLAGSCLAIALSHTIPSLVLIESRHQLPPLPLEMDKRVVALTKSSQKFLADLGCWQHVDKSRIQAFNEIRAWTDQGNFIEFPNKEMGWIVENLNLQQACWKRLKECNIQVLTSDFQEKTMDNQLKFTDGSSLSAQLIVGADGPQSKVRQQSHIDTWGWDYHQRAIVATLKVQHKEHSSIAWQRFLPSGPIAYLPMGSDRASLVWTVPQEWSRRLLALNSSKFHSLLNHTMLNDYKSTEYLISCIQDDGTCDVDIEQEFQWRIPKNPVNAPIVIHSFERGAFPLHFRNAQFYGTKGCVLVGDAAHTMHPLAGQGLNMGLKDVDALTKCLKSAVYHGQDISNELVLVNYTRECLTRNTAMLLTVDVLGRLLSSPCSIVNLGLRALNQLPMLKQPIAQWMHS